MDLSRQANPARIGEPHQGARHTLITDFAREKINRLMLNAGITPGGEKPWDIQIHDARFYSRVMFKWSLGFGESYMDGWWDTPALDQLICKLHVSRIDDKNNNLPGKIEMCKARLINQQTKR